ncbi:MAG: 6-carboxytetrahydropterin synthase [Planctomycetales bacterium]|nr:6-carboxytetrahydropterin synthase [Planctomycetales bacterium]
MESFRVHLHKEQLVFSAAHFITFGANICERLHGHNYGVRADVWGPLEEHAYVVDFIALRDELRDIVLALDHHVLLPTEHPTIRVTQTEREVTATFEDRRWVFPLEDCVLLPVRNTTAELLAKHIGGLLLKALAERGIHPARVAIGVDENHGQWGEWDSGPLGPMEP